MIRLTVCLWPWALKFQEKLAKTDKILADPTLRSIFGYYF